MSGTVTLLPLYAIMVCRHTTFTFYCILRCDNCCPHLCKFCLCYNPVFSLVSNDCIVRLDRVLNNYTLKQQIIFFHAAF